jgi:hypothetical protein
MGALPMKVSFAEILGSISAAIIKPIQESIAAMSQAVTDLAAAVTANTNATNALKSVADSLKAQNVQLLATTQTQAGQITDLTGQLATAKANQVDPGDAAAIAASTVSIQSATQTLADTAAADAPGN